ncbi:MAG: hypothetical protein ACOX2O_08495 [Bdellovibrionota bacterium]
MRFLYGFFLTILFITTCSAPSLADTTKRAMPQLLSTMKRPRAPKRRPHRPYVKILYLSFQRTASNRGIWKGAIKGHGDVSLHLNILNNGVLHSSRYMGNVRQHYDERPTSFKFIGSTPKERNWTWKIVAKAS